MSEGSNGPCINNGHNSDEQLVGMLDLLRSPSDRYASVLTHSPINPSSGNPRNKKQPRSLADTEFELTAEPGGLHLDIPDITRTATISTQPPLMQLDNWEEPI